MSTEVISPSGEGKDKSVTIVVNGRPDEWPKGKITYAEVVSLAFPNNAGRTYSVMYERGQSGKEGILPPGGSVEVKEGMVFRVTDTGES